MKKNMRIFSYLMIIAICLTITAACSADSPAGGPAAPAASTVPGSASSGGGGAGAQPQGWTFDRRIEVMLPSGEGTNADLTMRKFTEFLEGELGVDIVLTNMPGASGVTGYTWARDQVHDGYFFQYTSPSAIGAATLGNFDFDFFSEIQPVAGLLNSSNLIFTRKGAPFITYEEMAAYAKANPGKVSMAMQSTTGIDGACTGQFLMACDYDLNLINYEADAIVACLSGQLDLIMNTFGECEAYVDSGDLIPLVVISDSRTKMLPDVPCSVELGLDATLGPWFGFTCFNTTPSEAQKAFAEAVLKCAENPEWLAFLENMGYNTEFACGTEAFSQIVQNTEGVMKEAFSYFDNF